MKLTEQTSKHSSVSRALWERQVTEVPSLKVVKCFPARLKCSLAVRHPWGCVQTGGWPLPWGWPECCARALPAQLRQPGLCRTAGEGGSRALSLCPRLLLQNIHLWQQGCAFLSKVTTTDKGDFAGAVTQLWIWAPWHAGDQHSSKALTSPAGRSGTAPSQTSWHYPSLPGHSSALQGTCSPGAG